jgi:hypothetical protein
MLVPADDETAPLYFKTFDARQVDPTSLYDVKPTA